MSNIFLVGYMGAGKSTIGRKVAEAMGKSFVDMDLSIETRYRKTIAELFAEKGEPAFRTIEREMLLELASLENTVVATGGGTPCFFDNMQQMNRLGMTIYLKVSPSELARRVISGKTIRPLLAGKKAADMEGFIADALLQREYWYNQAALIFSTEKEPFPLKTDAVAARLIQRIREY
jgi:shikimate kinase